MHTLNLSPPISLHDCQDLRETLIQVHQALAQHVQHGLLGSCHTMGLLRCIVSTKLCVLSQHPLQVRIRSTGAMSAGQFEYAHWVT